MNGHRYKIASPPFEESALNRSAQLAQASRGVDYAGTVAWLSQFHSESALKQAVAGLWAECHPQLRDLSLRIVRVGALCDDTHLDFGIAIELARPLQVWIQQAPLGLGLSKRLLQQRLLTASSPTLAQMFAFAPGLHRDDSAILAVPEFLHAPMDIMARDQVGSSVDDCIHADVAVFSRANCAFEIAWRRTRPGRGFIVADFTETPYLYLEEFTERLCILGMSVSELVSLFLQQPEELFEVAQRKLFVGGAQIDWYRSGEVARSRFDVLSQKDRVVVGLRAAYRAIATFDSGSIATEIMSVLNSCNECVVLNGPIDEAILKRAKKLHNGIQWKELSKISTDVVAATILPYLPEMIESWNGIGNGLRYPDFRLVPGSRLMPVYQGVERDIRLLSNYVEQLSGDHGKARAMLACSEK